MIRSRNDARGRRHDRMGRRTVAMDGYARGRPDHQAKRDRTTANQRAVRAFCTTRVNDPATHLPAWNRASAGW